MKINKRRQKQIEKDYDPNKTFTIKVLGDPNDVLLQQQIDEINATGNFQRLEIVDEKQFLDGDLKAKKTLNMLGFKPYEIIEDEYKSESGNLIDKYKTIMTKDEWFSKTGRIKL